MKKFIYLLLLTPFFSCVDDSYPLGPSATLNLNFHAKFNGQPLVLGKAYQYPSGEKIKFDDFSFFVASLILQEAETAYELDLLEVGLVDFSANTDPTNVKPVTFTIRSVPAIPYRGLDIKVGVPSKFNKESILDFGAGHPVRQAFDTHFWLDGKSFFFMKMAGIYDANGDSEFSTSQDVAFEHFPFGNSNFTALTFDRTFNVKDGEVFNINISVDLAKLYADPNGGQMLDLAHPGNASTYSPKNETLSAFLMANFKQAMKVE